MKSHTKNLVCVLKQELGNVRSGAEIGVWEGHNSLGLFQTFPDLFLWMIDPWDKIEVIPPRGKTVKDFIQAQKTATRLTQPFDNRRHIVVATSQEASQNPLITDLDFVYIDACHLYEHVKEDIELWFPKVRSGGIIAGHDYNGLMDKNGKWGVKRAVDTFFKSRCIIVYPIGKLIWWCRKP